VQSKKLLLSKKTGPDFGPVFFDCPESIFRAAISGALGSIVAHHKQMPSSVIKAEQSLKSPGETLGLSPNAYFRSHIKGRPVGAGLDTGDYLFYCRHFWQS
jgi:hypothetical protein